MRLIAACLASLLIAIAAHSDDGLAQVYKKQCDSGDAFYCQAYGVMLSEGRGVPVDKTMATVYLGKACDADAAVACRYLADLYTAHDGVRRIPSWPRHSTSARVISTIWNHAQSSPRSDHRMPA
jgi:hypothetical protein